MADSFQLVIDDTSPVLSYYPFSDTFGVPDLQAGWNPYYTRSGFVSSPGQLGAGDSQHITSLDGAAFVLQWFGSAVELYGNVTGSASYDLVLDGQTNRSITTFSSDPTLLAAYQNLPAANHTLSLIVHNPSNSTSALIVIDEAVVTVNTALPNVTFSATVIDNTEIAFKGKWSFEQDPAVSPGDSTFHASNNAGDQAFFSFNGASFLFRTAVAVSGIRDIHAGHYSVTLDNETVQFDAQASWRELATLFYSTGLDPDVTHHITIINNEDRLLTIGSANVTSVSGQYPMTSSATSSGLHGGTIAAVVIAAVLGCLVTCLLFFCVWRRRRRLAVLRRRRMLSPPRKTDDTGGVLDIAPGADTAEDEDDRGDSKSKVYTKEGSISFTLDLPIQTRASRTSSQRTKSDNGIQILPRSPTVSLVRPQASHHRDSSRGALLLDVPSDSTPYLDVEEQSPFHVSFHMRSREGSGFFRRASGQEHSNGSGNGTRQPHDEEGLQLTPVTSQPPPRVNVISSSPHPRAGEGGDEGREVRYSFLDISSPELSLQEAPSVANHSSSSSSASPRSHANRLSGESERRRLSLVSAFNYHHSAPAFMALSPPLPPLPPIPNMPPRSASMLGQISSIRPLPRIPQASISEAEPARPQSSPSPPLFPPALTLQTHLPASGSHPLTSTSTPASGPGPHANIFLQTPSAAAAHATAASPTDSIPVTVSDIHFRHSSEGTDDDNRRASDLPPHPPLPARGYASPFIMQKLLGSQPVLGSPGLPGGVPFEPLRRQASPRPGPSSRPETDSRRGDEFEEEPPTPEGPTFAPGPSTVRPFWRS
ncbi:hypothetical protein DENSPDRAFT_206599 [Dentipellis sp. KUC8613]|nr:hypothetical protein DENSPDRAFT_206599 [Dentipellis sp. KUC8613]